MAEIPTPGSNRVLLRTAVTSGCEKFQGGINNFLKALNSLYGVNVKLKDDIK
jgi:hypothetical protein